MGKRKGITLNTGDTEEDSLVVKSIGTIGRWQLEKIFLLALCLIPLGWHYFAYPLISADKKYWCAKPDRLENWSTDEWINLITRNGTENLDHCNTLELANPMEAFQQEDVMDSNIVPCEKWDFEDTLDGGLALQEDFQLVCHRSGLLSFRQMVFFLGMLVGCLTTGNYTLLYL